MVRASAIAASAAVLMFSPVAFAQQTGTADEAKAMLIKAVAAVKADKAKALDMFNKGEGGFLIGTSMYFARMSATARPSPLATRIVSKPLVWTSGPSRTHRQTLWRRTLATYQKPEGEITEVSYMLPRPGADKTPVPKVSLATRVGDLGCGVGYYK